ncbi:MAG: HNH endonuclease [Tannerellaceae bacterium]|jgi:5-methylcytosine-specific restriction endonuclease McrA|nr:HNH endonuclease [Tannerellaceae bacterium]
MEQTFQHDYLEKLFDKRWLEKRTIILERDNRCCTICGSSEKLVVHHKQYHYIKKLQRLSDPWDYDNKYLITLCDSCHSKGHSKFNVPTKYI